MPDHSSFYRQQRQPSAPPLITVLEERVVGVTYDNRQDVVARLHVGERVRLCREPRNPYDRNAIRVENGRGEQIGYIRRELAAVLAPSLDAVEGVLPADVIALVGGDEPGYAHGVRIRFSVPGRVVQLPPVKDFDW
jgi:single-stranded-DNA-specific exonuclease